MKKELPFKTGEGGMLLLSHFSRVQLCATPEMAAHQAPPSLGFSKQEQWSGHESYTIHANDGPLEEHMLRDLLL